MSAVLNIILCALRIKTKTLVCDGVTLTDGTDIITVTY